MRQILGKLPQSLLLLVAVVTNFGCNDASQPSGAARNATSFEGDYPIRVVCTTGPVTDLVRAIGGDHLEVIGLMGPGVDPHLYREVPSDIERLASADMVFYNGLHLEGRMGQSLENLGRRKPTFAVTHGLESTQDSRLRKPPEFEGYFDPHVWHDARLWADCAEYVAGIIADFDPAHREDYLRNLEAYRGELLEADEYCRARLKTLPPTQRVLVTAHDAFGYFCPAYGLEPMPLKGVSTEEEVSIGRMDDVIRLLVERKIRAVFVETAVAPQIMNALVEPAKRMGWSVEIGGELYADALGKPGSGAETTAGMLRTNVDTIVSALADPESSSTSPEDNTSSRSPENGDPTSATVD